MSTRVELWTPKAGLLTRPGRTDVSGGTSSWVTVLDQNFDAVTLSDPVTNATTNAAMGGSGGSGSLASFAIISSGGGRAWRWHSPANTFDSSSGLNGLANFHADPFAAYTTAHGLILSAAIEYDITFPANMSWSLGGKIPGLGGTITASNPPTGGAAATANGWSCRSMWRGPGSGTYFGRTALSPNEWVGYRYCWDQAYPGENIWSGKRFIAGQKHTIRQEYVMNSVTSGTGNPDGIHRMFFDGEMVVEDTDVTWRTDATLGINRNLWHFFRGGNDSTWVGSVDNDIIVDNLKIQVGA